MGGKCAHACSYPLLRLGTGSGDLFIEDRLGNVFRGGYGEDTARGGRGQDALYGGQLADSLAGNRGADELDGDPGANDNDGGPGIDRPCAPLDR